MQCEISSSPLPFFFQMSHKEFDLRYIAIFFSSGVRMAAP